MDIYRRLLELERRTLRMAERQEFARQQQQIISQSINHPGGIGGWPVFISDGSVFTGWSDTLELRYVRTEFTDDGYIYNAAVTLPQKVIRSTSGSSTYEITFPPSDPYPSMTFPTTDQDWLFSWTSLPVRSTTNNGNTREYFIQQTVGSFTRYGKVFAENRSGVFTFNIEQGIRASGAAIELITKFFIQTDRDLPFTGTTGLREFDQGIHSVTGRTFNGIAHTIPALGNPAAKVYAQIRW